MERKLQQQTLSIRISETLREFLERSKQVISNARGESVSTSDVAKILLESAKDDLLDHRLEMAELQRTPTESLIAIRKKWEYGQPLSRAEWIFLGQYIQIACEEISEDPRMPTNSAFVAVLEAVLAIRSLRVDRGTGLDRYYVGNLGDANSALLNERQFDPESAPRVMNELIKVLRESVPGKKPSFAGRNLFVALRDEELTDVVALNRVLEPYLPALLRLAARGHWIREQRPLQVRREQWDYRSPIAPRIVGAFRLDTHLNTEGELSMVLIMDVREVVYPISRYPEIRDFAAMLSQLQPGKIWNGRHFHGFSDAGTTERPGRFHFRRHRDGVQFSFQPEEWATLNGMVAGAMAEPAMQPVLAELALVYGEL